MSDDAVRARLVLPCVNSVSDLHPVGQGTVDFVIFAQKGTVQTSNKVLSERRFLDAGFRFHHLERYFTCDHLLHASYVRFANDLSEEQKNFGLPVGERVALDMVAVVVEIHRKTAGKPCLVVGNGLDFTPCIECLV